VFAIPVITRDNIMFVNTLSTMDFISTHSYLNLKIKGVAHATNLLTIIE
jgi:hypothetical protein